MELRVNPDRVRQARVSAGLSQKDLADVLACSARTIQQWESSAGTDRPQPRLIRLLAEATGRPVAWFFEAEIAA